MYGQLIIYSHIYSPFPSFVKFNAADWFIARRVQLNAQGPPHGPVHRTGPAEESYGNANLPTAHWLATYSVPSGALPNVCTDSLNDTWLPAGVA